MRLLLDLVRKPILLALFAGVLILLARSAVQFPFVAQWDPGFLIPPLRTWTDPLLTQAGARVGIPWTPDSQNLLPLGLALVLGVLIVAVNAVFEWLRRALPSRSPRPAAEPAPAVAPAPAEPSRVSNIVAAPANGTGAEGATTLNPSALARTPAHGAAGARAANRIGRYEIIEELGRGAMGVVYKARDPQIGRIVAIKTILLAADDPSADVYRKRFIVEAKSAGQLNHPGIVTVYDFAEDAAGQPCLVLEFIEGMTLEKQMRKERLPLRKVLDITIQVARALDYAHQRGIIHRDMKPANIMLTGDGYAKVSDFGIAKMEGVNLTKTGQVLGTPAFMSPEQSIGTSVDRRTDIFALGSILYWLASGERPFHGDTITALMYKLVHVDPVPAHKVNPALPPDLDRIIGKCLAKNPDARYPSAAALAADLEALRDRHAPAG